MFEQFTDRTIVMAIRIQAVSFNYSYLCDIPYLNRNFSQFANYKTLLPKGVQNRHHVTN